MNMMKAAARWVGVLLVGTTLTVHALSEKQQQEMEARIKPAGSVCLEGDSSCGAGSASAVDGAKSPEQIYNTYCMACHTTGAAGAPKIGDAAAWKERVAKGMDTVYANAINGFKAMPAKGLCTTCSDDEIKDTVDYILSNSK